VAEVRDDLAADGVPAGDIRIELGADLRFLRQTFELPIAWDGDLSAAGQEQLGQRFIAEYTARYGEGATVSGAPVELVTIRAIGMGSTVRAELTSTSQVPDLNSVAPTAATHRAVHTARSGQPEKVPVYRRTDLIPGQTISGPALVDSVDTTTWVPHGVPARNDAFANLDMELAT